MENDEDNLTEFLPSMRCTPAMKAALQEIARNSVARNLTDHIRYALERYINEETGNAETLIQRERVTA